MPGLITLQIYESAELAFDPVRETPRAAWWMIRVSPETEFGSVAHTVLMDMDREDRMQGLMVAFGVWAPLALGRFVRDTCRELVGEDRAASVLVYGEMPERRNYRRIEWPEDGQQVFLESGRSEEQRPAEEGGHRS